MLSLQAYQGVNCSEEVNECIPNPCNGWKTFFYECIDEIGTYRCELVLELTLGVSLGAAGGLILIIIITVVVFVMKQRYV